MFLRILNNLYKYEIIQSINFFRKEWIELRETLIKYFVHPMFRREIIWQRDK